MHPLVSLDAQVRARLQSWPQRPPGLIPARRDLAWVRGRPGEPLAHDQPFLKIPGSTHLRTLPDGLYLGFGGSMAEAYVDVIAIEACGSISNLLDKRSRFAPSTQSLMAVCPPRWLNAHWQLTGLLRGPPPLPLILPVRDMRVLYGLKTRHYAGFTESQVPHAHEYFVPMDALTAEDACQNPRMQALVGRAAVSANFFPQ